MSSNAGIRIVALYIEAESVKQFPGFENLPRSFWHELSSPFTEVYK
ncbi:hypothetical protein ALC53_12621 [Atta colombica]|uniref:Uncharacterized protein n=1 Tax=Atta colombica TaxID=520822 RepID=A0A151HYY0_9HYME|nr:hypothetical protein ALC53_12621 [Atta colombica]